MIKCLVVTYNDLGKELVNISEKICGKKNFVNFLETKKIKNEQDLKEQIKNKINSFKSKGKALVLIDVFASPHSKILIDYKEKVKIISGVNLSMVIAVHKAIAQGETDIENISNEIKKQSIESIIDFDELRV